MERAIMTSNVLVKMMPRNNVFILYLCLHFVKRKIKAMDQKKEEETADAQAREALEQAQRLVDMDPYVKGALAEAKVAREKAIQTYAESGGGAEAEAQLEDAKKKASISALRALAHAMGEVLKK